MNWYLKVLREYAVFSGRAHRKEYWMFVLFNLIFAVIAMILDNVLGTVFTIGSTTMGYGYVYVAYNLFVLIPSVAAAVRRLHDVGKSGWFLLISLIPLIGAIWLLVVLATDSNPGDNKYGPNPKQAELSSSINPTLG